MRLLLTGSSGFIGTNFCEAFHRNYELVGVDLNPPKEAFPNIKYYLADILDVSTLDKIVKAEKPDVIVHAAAQARVDPSYKDPIGTFRTNIQGTINLLDAALKHGVKRFVYLSSETIYGQADRYPTKETDHFRPISAYAASKISGDVITQCCHGLETVVVRSAMGYGPRSPPEQVVTKFFIRVMEGKPLLFPKGNVVHPSRDVNYVGNFMDGVRLVIEHPNPARVYNIGSGRELSILGIAEKVIETVGSGEIVFTKEFKYRPGEEGVRTWLDITKAREDLGYEPRISFEQGLKLTYEWLRNNLSYWSSGESS